MNGSNDLRRNRRAAMALAVAIGLLLVVNAGSAIGSANRAAPGVNAACYPTQQALVTVQQSPHGVASTVRPSGCTSSTTTATR